MIWDFSSCPVNPAVADEYYLAHTQNPHFRENIVPQMHRRRQEWTARDFVSKESLKKGRIVDVFSFFQAERLN